MTSLSLTRVVRFHVSHDPQQQFSGSNSYAGHPASEGLSTFCQIEACCYAPCDPETGFIESIYVIDDAVRAHVAPRISAAYASREPISPRSLLPELFQLVDLHIDARLDQLVWCLSPYHQLHMNRTDMTHAIIKRKYTFSAAHRLYNRDMDDDRNTKLFGKCSWPSGHGHNYELEVSVAVPADLQEAAMTIEELDSIVQDRVIELFDHRHLNLDIEAFKTMNPTLENITVECHRLLQDDLDQDRGRLTMVEVWETDRTSCACHAQGQEVSP